MQSNPGDSPLNQIGMHAFRVYCNGWLIASFATERMRAAFIAERQRKYPRNVYDGFAY